MSHNELETKEKFNTIDSLLGGDHTFIHIDTRLDGVELPENLMSKHNVTLKLSRQFRGEIELKAEEIIADLLFPEGYHSCKIPLDAVWGITDESGKNMIWPQSTPKEILEDMVSGPAEAVALAEEPEDTNDLSPSGEPPIDEPSDQNSKLAKRKIPHLKRVK